MLLRLITSVDNVKAPSCFQHSPMIVDFVMIDCPLLHDCPLLYSGHCNKWLLASLRSRMRIEVDLPETESIVELLCKVWCKSPWAVV